MNYIERAIVEEIKNKLKTTNKIIFIYGARQVGKTTLVKNILSNLAGRKCLSINADEKRYLDVLSSRDLSKMKLLTAGYDLLFIDEAQRIPEIGINLKILHDQMPELKIIVTGSSSLELASKTKEPLTGRNWTYSLFPLSWLEIRNSINLYDLQSQLEYYLIYGSYPELTNIPNARDKELYLNELCSSYLYKDILELSSIKHSRKLHDLLKLLAFQVGSLVSVSELASHLQLSKETVETYIDLLEKSFVLFRLKGFSRNLRKEITKMNKIYFYDLGIRNTIINNFNRLTYRDDQGKLWENFLLMERKKYLAYNNIFANTYFWRTYTGVELDYIEERDGKLMGFEFKFGNKSSKPPRSWMETYSNSEYSTINKENFLNFIL